MKTTECWAFVTTTTFLILIGGFHSTGCGGSDGDDSEPPVVELTVESGTPVVPGDEIRLDASASTDPDGDPLEFRWELRERPASSSTAGLKDRELAVARFTPDVTGEYVVEVNVSDRANEVSRSAAIEVVDEESRPPVADAGADVVAPVGAEVAFDGSGSNDPDGDSLAFSWRFSSKPGASSAELDGAERRIVKFTLDEPGTYELTLTVSDGGEESEDTVVARANRPPTAVAEMQGEVPVGTSVALDGSASSDPDDDRLSYRWSLVSVPESSEVGIVDADRDRAKITPDAPGAYLVELEVTDGTERATDRRSVEAVPEDGSGSSTLYVSTGGDDADPGSRDEPLATLEAALAKVSENESIARIQLAAGTYDQGSTEHAVARDLDIVGVEEGAKPIVTGSADLFSIDDTAFVTLLRLELRSEATAIKVGDDAGVSVTRVDCRARRCLVSGAFPSPNGGRVTVRHSTFSAAGDAQNGVTAVRSDDITIADTVIEGFDGNGAGVRIFDSPVAIRDSIVRGNGVGVELSHHAARRETVIADSQFEGNDIGLEVDRAKNVTVRRTTFESSLDVGILVSSGALRLETATVQTGDGDGLVVRDSGTDGSLVVLRDSDIHGNLGDGIRVEGYRTTLDLGNESTAGGNDIRMNKGVSLNDVRADDAPAFITLKETRLAFQPPPAGSHEGPNFLDYGMRIENANTITVY